MKEKNMGEFKFNSQVCTSIEQSERLLALGLKKETADMRYYALYLSSVDKWYNKEYPEVLYDGERINNHDIPAWSLHRLIEMMPNNIGTGEECYITQVVLCKRIFAYMDFGSIEYMFGEKDNSYDNAINCIEWLIKEGYFNNEYLCEK